MQGEKACLQAKKGMLTDLRRPATGALTSTLLTRLGNTMPEPQVYTLPPPVRAAKPTSLATWEQQNELIDCLLDGSHKSGQ